MGTQRARSTGTGTCLGGVYARGTSVSAGARGRALRMAGPPHPFVSRASGEKGSEKRARERAGVFQAGLGRASILRTQEATVGVAGGGGEREAAVTLQRAVPFSGQDPPRGLEEVTR